MIQDKLPLAEKLRPLSLDEIVGQDDILKENGFIWKIIKGKKPLSLLLWGPPGCGKTTLAKIYAQAFDAHFISFSAVFQGVGDLKKIVEDIQKHPLLQKKTIIFVDEIHRFNRAQQDAFLPFLEDGTFILVGATTENPSFSLNNALLSRLRVITLSSLSEEALEKIVDKYEKTIRKLPLTLEARSLLIEMAQGDGRYLLNLIENIEQESDVLDIEKLSFLLQKKAPLYDKHEEIHHYLISALHKSVRGSDPDSALYWLARMLEGGESPHFLARRLVRMAIEDIGLADPAALEQTLHAWDAYNRLGSPEGELALAQAVVFLALAPKSCSVYQAFSEAQELAKTTSHLMPPKTTLNSPTKLMKKLGYGEGYQYDHDTKEGFSGQHYFPESMERKLFYRPVERGFEREMKKRLDYFASLRKQKKENSSF